jgi:hypothetical protein
VTIDTAESRAFYSDALSSLPRGRAIGTVSWTADTWHSTLDMERAVDAYLSSKPLREQLDLARLMGDIEMPVPLPPVAPARSRTETLDSPFLRMPGAGAALAVSWNRRLGL